MRRPPLPWLASTSIGMVATVSLAAVLAGCGGGSTQAPTTEERTATATSPSESVPDTTDVYQVSEENQLTGEELVELRLLVLELVNRNRAEAGVAPVELGSNPSAQYHADELLAGDYLGHWTRDGRRAHMVYADFGGTSYALPSGAASGWTQAEWDDAGCGNILDLLSNETCERPDVREKIRNFLSKPFLTLKSMSTQLMERHRKVNIGIAFNGRRMTYVAYFEGGDLEVVERPTLEDGVLRLSVRKNMVDLQMGYGVWILREPKRGPLDPTEIETLQMLCSTGGEGFSEECSDYVALVQPPDADPFTFGIDLDSVSIVVPEVWIEGDDSLEVVADLGSAVSDQGVYSVIVMEGPWEEYLLWLPIVR